MANVAFNISKGRTVELYNRVKSADPGTAKFNVILLKASEADSVLIDYDDISTLLGAAGNTEADFTNYARVEWVAADLAALPAPNDTSDAYELDFPDLQYTNAGGTTDNTMTKLVLSYDELGTGVDANMIPVGAWDYTGTTDGSTINIQFPTNAYSAG